MDADVALAGGGTAPLLGKSPQHCQKADSLNSNGHDHGHAHHHHGHSSARIGVAAVVAISFFNVSGGPWGSEDIFSTAGPAFGTLGLLLFTIFFSLPQCLLTAELSCAFPNNAGYAIWVREAFGDFWGVQECYWQWVSGIIDAAVYPVLICDTFLQMTGYQPGATEVWLWRVCVTLILSVPTMSSVATVPAVLITFAATSVVPVVAFIALGSTRLHPKVWMQGTRGASLNMGKFINVLFWNLEGWDCISTCAAMIDHPREKTIPRGLMIALVAVGLQYVLVLMVAAAISENSSPWQDWNDGSLPSIGSALGPCMGVMLLVASVVGNAGQYLSEFFENSYMLQGTADVGIAPHAFSWRLPWSDAPYMAVAFQFCLIALLVVMDFADILVFDNAFTATAVLLEFAAFVRLRWRQPERLRPFRVSTPLLLLLVPAVVLLLVVIYHCFATSWRSTAISLAAFALGVPYGSWVAWRDRKDEATGHKSAFDQWLENEEEEDEEADGKEEEVDAEDRKT